MSLKKLPVEGTLEKIKQVFIKDQLPENFGIEFTEVTESYIRGTLKVENKHLRPGKIMNGGVSLVLVETLGSVGSSLFINFPEENALGIQVSANHLGKALPGDTLTATARPVHIGKRTHLWEVEIENQNRRVISSGRITMMITT